MLDLFSLESWVESKLALMGLSCLGDGGNVAEIGEVRRGKEYEEITHIKWAFFKL